MFYHSSDKDIQEALRSCRSHFAAAAVFHGFSNLLLLAYPLYMINVFDRVLTSQSRATLLVLLSGLALALFFKGIFQWLQSTLFIRASMRLDRRLTERLVAISFERRAAGLSDNGGQVLRDLDRFRQYVTGKGGLATIDAPWAGLFLGVLFLADFWIGVVALVAILIIALLTIVNSTLTRSSLATTNRLATDSYAFVDANLRSAEAVIGMGMLKSVMRKWHQMREPALAAQAVASSRGAAFYALLGFVRIFAQGAILAVGAVQVINGSLPNGVMFAAIIMFQFAMRPMEQIISSWSEYQPVKQGLKRIEDMLAKRQPLAERMPLPRPSGELTVKKLTYAVPGMDRPILRNINFGIHAGKSLGIAGLSGSGKTTLARLLTGCVKPTSGAIRLDGIEVWGWSQVEGGLHIGYLPQNIGLLTGTVAENIGRFGRFDEAEIVAASEMANAHEMILRLPFGYDTPIGDGGRELSGGQRQLIGLARAVIGPPSLVVLDEPNSNLDGPGEDALMSCVRSLKEVGTTVIFISHRPNLVRQMHHVLLLKDGEVVGFGTADEVFKRLGPPVAVKKIAAKR